MSSTDSPLVLSEDNVLTLNLAQQAESQETGKPFKMGSPDSFEALLKLHSGFHNTTFLS